MSYASSDIGIPWKVAFKISFHYVISNFDACSEEMHCIVSRLAKKAYFVLFFESETIYAKSSVDGLEIFEKF